jgi:hypothetical protein
MTYVRMIANQPFITEEEEAILPAAAEAAKSEIQEWHLQL